MKHLAVVSCLLLLPLAFSCSDDVTGQAEPEALGRRTVLMYMAADNSLGGNDFSEKDFEELVQGSSRLSPNDRMLLFVDDDENPRIYRFMNGGKSPTIVRRWGGDVDSSSPSTLKDVLLWTMKYFPAAEYGLVLWSHATGWLPSTNTSYRQVKSFGIDTGDGNNWGSDIDENGNLGTQGNISDFAKVFSECGVKFKFMLWDACFMQNIESCYALRNCSEYIIASPMAISAYGAYYVHQVERGLFSKDPVDIARTYYEDATSKYLAEEYGDVGLVVSAVKTDSLESLAKKVSEILPMPGAVGRYPEMTGVLNYGAYSSHYYFQPHFYDALEVMRKILGAADFEPFKRLYEKVVVYKASTDNFYLGPGLYDYQDMKAHEATYGGMSMFVPQEIYALNTSRCIYGNLNDAFRCTEWYEKAGFGAKGW